LITIVAHDAGGAEILSSWIARSKESFCLVLAGPALDIFRRKLGNFKNYKLIDALNISDWVLTGTSWQSNLEKEAIIQSKLLDKKVISFLDHWVNYKERFLLSGQNVLPDEIWVGDIEALKIAERNFPESKILLQENPYFLDIQLALAAFKEKKNDLRGSILYVCEPINEHALKTYGDEYYWRYTEETALNYFFDNIQKKLKSIGQIKIRPHPSEPSNKYDWAFKKSKLVSEIGKDLPLYQQIAEADIVVGCESMAMVIALLANKRVISSIPPGGKKCGLPHSNIEHLKEMN